MKKINNGKFRGNNNTIYSLNYKFDSVCSAGKFCGTALDLIKKYNELAKEAHSNGNYVEMEVFRQYAEHYRKIVTEINERKNAVRENNQQSDNIQNQEESSEQSVSEEEESKIVENREDISNNVVLGQNEQQSENSVDTVKKIRHRRSFTIVEVAEKSEDAEEKQPKTRKRKISNKKLSEND